jgi:hypothetical protein
MMMVPFELWLRLYGADLGRALPEPLSPASCQLSFRLGQPFHESPLVEHLAAFQSPQPAAGLAFNRSSLRPAECGKCTGQEGEPQ